MNDTVRIDFDRPDRTYRSGQTVRGELVIHTDRGDSCGDVYLTRFWRTHGKGNPDRGDRKVMRLHEGPLRGSPPHRLPFEFEAPGGPFTYHGTFLNVDHYVEARVDLPGLFDPGPPEEYLLVPGSEVDPPHPELLKVTGTKSAGARGCRVVVGAFLILFGFFTLPFGLVLMVPGLFLTFPGLWRTLAGARLGEVSSTPAKMIAHPGGTVEIRVRLEPKKARTINAARAVLRGREIVISGTGSDQRVHMRDIHTREIELSGPRELTAGQRATLEGEFHLPDDAPYTFTSKHNEVAWDVTVSVDIPSWPDWHQEHKVVVWAAPAEEKDAPHRIQEAADVTSVLPARTGRAARPARDSESALRSAPTSPGDPPSAPKRSPRRPPAPGRPDAAPSTVSTPADSDAPMVSDPAEATPSLPDGGGAGPGADGFDTVEAPDPPSSRRESPLAAAVAAILEEKSFGGARDPLIRRLQGSRHTFDLKVDLVKHTFGAGPDPTYRHGRTVTGSVAGTGIAVDVRFPTDRNDEIDDYRRGAVHPVTATVVDWEKLSEKPVLEA